MKTYLEIGMLEKKAVWKYNIEPFDRWWRFAIIDKKVT